MGKLKFNTEEQLIQHVVKYQKKSSRKKAEKRLAHFGGSLPRQLKWAQFIISIFRYDGTIFSKSWVPVLLGFIMGGLFKLLFDAVDGYSIPTKLFTPVATLTAFLLVFRTNLAYSRYTEGRIKLGGIVASFSLIVKVCVTNLKDTQIDVFEVVRKSNLAFAFIRQDLRESRVPPGINNSDVESGDKAWKRLFGGGGKHAVSRFWVDYDIWGSPAMKTIITEEEISYYSTLKPNARVLMALTALGNEFAKGNASDVVNVAINGEIANVERAWRAACRIIDTPFPFVYNHLLHLMIFLFCYVIGPIVYAQELKSRDAYIVFDYVLCILASGGMALLFYGTNAIGIEIENPFGWHKNDHNISRFCKALNKEMEMMTKWHDHKMMVSPSPSAKKQSVLLVDNSNNNSTQQSKYLASSNV